MYTLKIRWWREEEHEVPDSSNGRGQPIVDVRTADETTLYIPADEVRVLARVLNPAEEMSQWPDDSYLNYQALSVNGRYQARIIQVLRKGVTDEFYLASQAWLLGPNGDTIERIAP